MEHIFHPAPQKRLHIPTFDTLFNRNKRRKLPDGIQDKLAGFSGLSLNEDSVDLEEECYHNEKKRQEIINQTLYTQDFKVKPWNSTVPEPFKLHTQERSRKKQDAPKLLKTSQDRIIYKAKGVSKSKIDQNSQDAGNLGFKALPLNKKILQRPDFQLKKTEARFTQPHEFHLHTEQRAALSQSSQISIDSQPCCPSNSQRSTHAKPFKLLTETRSLVRQQRYIQSQGIEPEYTSFKAQPLPSFYSSSQQSIQSQSQDFDPEPAYGTTFEYPKKQMNGSFTLNSEVRAEQRALFNENLRQRQKKQEDKRRYEEEQKKQQDDEEIRRLRKNLEFKAKPSKYSKFSKSLSIDTEGISYASTETSLYDVEMKD